DVSWLIHYRPFSGGDMSTEMIAHCRREAPASRVQLSQALVSDSSALVGECHRLAQAQSLRPFESLLPTISFVKVA
ncbi:MAG TPA: hypothetical protein VFS84_15255, partial [Candidatus Binatia bacterium]|nr:hypothetical protein [Candidatus Binatia bacterium]